jgi:hypothetical protein
MMLCEWDASEGHPGQSCLHLFARILSSSLTSVSIFSVCCYSIVSISVVPILTTGEKLSTLPTLWSELTGGQFRLSHPYLWLHISLFPLI